MGDVGTSLLDAAVASETATEAPSTDEAPHEVARRRIPRRAIAIGVVGALVITGGVIGGVAWANRVAHDEALAAATTARSELVGAVEAQRTVVRAFEGSVTEAIALRDALATEVLANASLLGGADALAALTAAHSALAAELATQLEVAEPISATPIPDAAPLEMPGTVDAELGTDELKALTAGYRADAKTASAATAALTTRAGGLDAALGAAREQLTALVATIPTVDAALIASNPLASTDSQAAASAAVTALGAASADADLPALLAAYATAASGVIAAQQAEAARIAAEEAAKAAAAKRSRTGGGGGGGGGSSGGGGGVLGETNAARAANGVAALSGNGTLNSRSCTFAAELAANNGDLYHSAFAGGFSTWGENVAYGYGSAAAVVAGWMNSSGHRANILNSAFTQMGACSATSSTGRVYWVQQFGG
ncbi:MAG: hypothetical protein DI534_00440 [Leifsonia xyli]|nr:MAG: hypothetical protein DI534_00440 [Leifsonia xyli]